jgi:hypothetical protein
MTKKYAKAFVKFLVGILPQKMKYADARKICLTMHLVYKDSNGELTCTCKGHYRTERYSHRMAYLHLHNKIDVEEEIKLISCPKSSGRPKKYKKVGYGCHNNDKIRRKRSSNQPISSARILLLNWVTTSLILGLLVLRVTMAKEQCGQSLIPPGTMRTLMTLMSTTRKWITQAF